MAMSFVSFISINLLVLLASSPFFISEARPLKVSKSSDVFYIKSSGPSHGGGHKYINARNIGAVNHSGPAHGYTTTTPQVLGGIKHSGPSHGGEGNHYTTKATGTLGGFKNSGPSHGGEGNGYTTKALGGFMHSGPSHGGSGN